MSLPGRGVSTVWPLGHEQFEKENTHTCSSCGTVYLDTLHYCPHCPSNFPIRGKKGKKKSSDLFVRMPKKGKG